MNSSWKDVVACSPLRNLYSRGVGWRVQDLKEIEGMFRFPAFNTISRIRDFNVTLPSLPEAAPIGAVDKKSPACVVHCYGACTHVIEYSNFLPRATTLSALFDEAEIHPLLQELLLRWPHALPIDGAVCHLLALAKIVDAMNFAELKTTTHEIATFLKFLDTVPLPRILVGATRGNGAFRRHWNERLVALPFVVLGEKPEPQKTSFVPTRL